MRGLMLSIVAAWLLAGQFIYHVPASGGGLTCNGTTVICVTQSGAGAQDGSSAANAHSMSWLNTAGNWGGGGSEVDPGDTVSLSGTITSNLTVAGNGSSGNVVTIDGTNATLSNIGVTFTSKSFVTLDHFTWADGLTDGIDLTSSSNIIVQNCYAHETIAGNFWYNAGAGNSSNTIRYCSVTQAANSSAFQQDILKIEGGSTFVIDGNLFTLRANSNCAECHDDAFQTYSSPSTPSNVVVRYNYWTMNSTQSENKSILQWENLTGTNYLYGNVFYCNDGAGGANMNVIYPNGAGTATWIVYNNTTYAKAGSCENTWRWTLGGGSDSLNFRNNIVSSSAGTVYASDITTTRQYNNWFGSNAPSCSGTGEVCTSPAFTSQSTGDLTLTVSSPGKGTGIVIANTGGQTFDVGLDPAATWPNPAKKTRGASWDMGAFCHTSCG